MQAGIKLNKLFRREERWRPPAAHECAQDGCARQGSNITALPGSTCCCSAADELLCRLERARCKLQWGAGLDRRMGKVLPCGSQQHVEGQMDFLSARVSQFSGLELEDWPLHQRLSQPLSDPHFTISALARSFALTTYQHYMGGKANSQRLFILRFIHRQQLE
jgi:hypothetical protein